MQITVTFDPSTLTDEDLRILSAMTGIKTQTTTVVTPTVAPAKAKAAKEIEPEPEAVEDEPVEDEPAPAPAKKAPAKKAAAKKAAAKPEPEPEVDDSDVESDAEDEDTAETRAACEAALLARLGTGGPEARTEVREILATVGARRLSEVNDEDLSRLLEALQA